MPKRGVSISVKMIAASTLVIVLTIVGFGFLNIFNIGRLYDDQAKETIAQFRESLASKGETTTLVFSQALLAHLINNEFDDIRALATKAAEQDPGLAQIYVLDRNRGVITHTAAGRYGSEHPPITDSSWTAIEAEWKRRVEAAELDALVGVEHASTSNGNLLYFAYPIAQGAAAPTASQAVAPEPGGRLGYVVLGYSLDPIARFAAESRNEKRAASRVTIVRTAALGGLFALIGILLAVFQGLSISKPLKVLAHRAEQIAGGDLDSRVEVSSRDEIGALGESFNFMADQLVVLLRETAEKATMEKDLEVARTIQETLVPPPDPVDHGTLRFAGFFQPAAQCGGDWWTYHPLGDGKLLLVIGDVTGHGVPSAMITATAKAACDVARSVYRETLGVGALLAIMNDAILQSAKRKFVMTCFASVYDPETRSLTYANAGHNFPYLYRVDGGGKGKFSSLMARGNRLGDVVDSRYEEQTTALAAGDTIIWYTDGIVECENDNGDELGDRRFRRSIEGAISLDVGALRDQLVSDAYSFYGQVPRKDDITMVVGRVA